MKQLSEEVLFKYYQGLANRIEKDPTFLTLCQEEMANVLYDYPLSVAEYVQKNELVSFNALEFLGTKFLDVSSFTNDVMFKGELYLEYDGSISYNANVSRCIFRKDEVVLDFSGNDEGRKFEGNCKLIKNQTQYTGNGAFRFLDELQSMSSIITASLEMDKNGLTLKGSWKDCNESESYILTIDLYEN